MTGCSAAVAQYSPAGAAQHACVSGGSLPLTGFSVGILLAVAAILLVVGVALHEKAST